MLIPMTILAMMNATLTGHQHNESNSASLNHPEIKYQGPYAPLKYDGTVDETPEVKVAKAAHFSALANAGYYNPYHYYYTGPYYSYFTDPWKYYQPAPINPDGSVGNTEEVKHAIAVLNRAHNEAKAKLHYVHLYGDSAPLYSDDGHHDYSFYTYGKKYYGPLAPLRYDGTVDETDDVKHAKAVLFKAQDEAKARLHYIHQHPDSESHNADYDADYDSQEKEDSVSKTPEDEPKAARRIKRSAVFQPAPLKPDGTVDETPEVKNARNVFLAALAAEYAQADHSWVEPEYYHDEPTYYAHAASYPYQSAKSQKPIISAIPIIPKSAPSVIIPAHPYYKNIIPAPLLPDGTVDDTDAIKLAKAVHFAAHQQANARNVPYKYLQSHY